MFKRLKNYLLSKSGQYHATAPLLNAPEYTCEENRMDARILTDPIYAAKKQRERMQQTSAIEDVEILLLNRTKHLSNEFHNYPFKLMPLAAVNAALREKIECIYRELHTFLPSHHQDTFVTTFDWIHTPENTSQFVKFTYSAYEKTILDSLESYLFLLDAQHETIQQILIDDVDTLKKIKSFMTRIHNFSSLSPNIAEQKIKEQYPEFDLS